MVQRRIDKLIDKHETIARQVRYYDMTGKNRERNKKLKEKMRKLEFKIAYLSEFSRHRVCWEEEYYYARAGIEKKILHPYQIYRA